MMSPKLLDHSEWSVQPRLGRGQIIWPRSAQISTSGVPLARHVDPLLHPHLQRLHLGYVLHDLSAFGRWIQKFSGITGGVYQPRGMSISPSHHDDVDFSSCDQVSHISPSPNNCRNRLQWRRISADSIPSFSGLHSSRNLLDRPHDLGHNDVLVHNDFVFGGVNHFFGVCIALAWGGVVHSTYDWDWKEFRLFESTGKNPCSWLT